MSSAISRIDELREKKQLEAELEEFVDMPVEPEAKAPSTSKKAKPSTQGKPLNLAAVVDLIGRIQPISGEELHAALLPRGFDLPKPPARSNKLSTMLSNAKHRGKLKQLLGCRWCLPDYKPKSSAPKDAAKPIDNTNKTPDPVPATDANIHWIDANIGLPSGLSIMLRVGHSIEPSFKPADTGASIPVSDTAAIQQACSMLSALIRPPQE